MMPNTETGARSNVPDETLVQQTLASIGSTPGRLRVAAGAVLLAAGVSALVLGASLLHGGVPGTGFVVVLMLEPAGVFLVCTALVALAPHGVAIQWFRGSYFRLRTILFILAFAGGTGALLLIGALLLELVRQ